MTPTPPEGWTVTPILLYDEEGVEGLLWRGPDGQEVVTFADELPPLQGVGDDTATLAKNAERQALADLLDRLLED